MSMSDDDARLAIKGLGKQIESYADLLIRKGVAIRPGQELVIQAPIECADFVRLLVRRAYKARAGHVTVIWKDDELTRLEFEHVNLAYFKTTPEWKVAQLNGLADKGASFLFIEGTNPDALAGIDPEKPAAAMLARNRDCASFRDGMDYRRNVWCVAGAPIKAWARKVFPYTGDMEAIYRLWAAILSVSRADGEDPQGEWETHNAAFEKNKRFLNEAGFVGLRYKSSNGTNLRVGLNPHHLWDGGACRTMSGTMFFPNIPTEEVFTTPDRMSADGIVYSVLPLVHAGQMIVDFWIRFEDGRVVDYDAAQGKETLRQIIEGDENSCRLGEVALISKNTPIRQSGLLFYDTLYDENASCHLALGTGFPECIEGGLDMSVEELMQHGVNHSNIHVDFMIGADDLCVWGIESDGHETEIFVDGQWVWEAKQG